MWELPELPEVYVAMIKVLLLIYIYIQYSFDVVMNTFATGKGPEHDRAHDINLAKDICDGESLEIPNDFTQD